MAACEVCGNEYDGAFAVITPDRQEHTFDSIECAAQAIAPTCAHCDCRILGHGVQAGDKIYCCANCARNAGTDAVRDRA
ncbi:hypothetical protein [Kribbella shirazensis]|uniref:Metallothionein n=1 Tax=Kribbella shirazensis TaxID=1105143 RepID=A0A7X5VI08_9ACTN|nr:hypothetical protein [Kribbella shirazensis]NIK61600.1 hypothetical protein [Kribbella shirazensis]